MAPQIFVFFGQSGSGKGTQAKLLIKYLEENRNNKVLYIETGAKIREFMEEASLTSRLTKEIIDTGGLLPEFLPIWLWTNYLNTHFTGKEDLVLDGLCRRINEAPVLDSAVKFYKTKNPCVISLNVSREWSYTKMKSRGRADDTDEYINSRLDWFARDVTPVLDYFRGKPEYAFLDINGEQSIEDVHKEIIEKIEAAHKPLVHAK